jgi:SAM-dependent methyltransferase
VIASWSSGLAEDHMDEAILVDLAGLIETHPWWKARASLTLTLLDRLGVRTPSRVLDAGCGWGVTLSALEKRGYHAVGLDVSRKALERLDAPGRSLVEADLTRPWPPDAETFDAVLALDVIEHLDDDRGAVNRLAERIVPGGVLIVSVPALPDLFGEFDAIQGHRRRYLPETLRAAFSESGLEVDRVFWWGEWLVRRLRKSRQRSRSRPGEPASQTYRRYLTLPPWPAPWLLRAMFAREQGPALDGKLTSGTSLFAVARKRSSPPSRRR